MTSLQRRDGRGRRSANPWVKALRAVLEEAGQAGDEAALAFCLCTFAMAAVEALVPSGQIGPAAGRASKQLRIGPRWRGSRSARANC